MAIDPKFLRLTELERTTLIEAEDYIDNELSSRYFPSGPVKITILLEPFVTMEHLKKTQNSTMDKTLISKKVEQEIKTRYREFGWEKIEIFYYPPQDKTYITLKAFSVKK